MPKNKLTPSDVDVLDGINIPTLPPSVRLEKPRSVPVTKLGTQEVEISSLKELDPNEDFGQLLNSIRSKIDDSSTFDSLTGQSFTSDAGDIASDLTNEQIEKLIDHTKQSISNIQKKSEVIMDAVIKRQEVDPTVVSFKSKEKALLKRGMVRVFGHKANTITFDQYRAALAARKLLADRLVKEKLGNV